MSGAEGKMKNTAVAYREERNGEKHTNDMLHNKTMESVADTRFPSHDRGEIEKQVNG